MLVTTPTRLRMSRTAMLPVVLLFLCVIPLAFAATWTLVFLLIPLAAAAWVLRAGIDLDEEAVTVRSVAGSRRVPWSQVAGIRIGRRRELWLVTAAGTELRLPALRARDLPRLSALSGGRIADPTAAPA